MYRLDKNGDEVVRVDFREKVGFEQRLKGGKEVNHKDRRGKSTLGK